MQYFSPFTILIGTFAASIATPATAQHYDVDDAVSANALSNPFEFSKPKPANQNFDTDESNDQYPQIATDNFGNTWIAVWESRQNLSGKIGDDYDILYAVSTDKGKTWNGPKWLNDNAKTDTGDDRKPSIAASNAAIGVWVVCWQTDDTLSGTIGTDLDIVWSKSLDAGGSWTSPAAIDANAATDTGEDENVHVSLNIRGNEWVVAVWQSNDTRSGTIGTDWDIIAAVTIDGRTETDDWPDVGPVNTDASTDGKADKFPQVGGESRSVVVVWERKQSSTDRDIYAVTEADGLGTVLWEAQTDVSNSSADSRRPSIGYFPRTLVSGINHFVVAWEERASKSDDWDIVVSDTPVSNPWNFFTWSTPSFLNRNAENDDGDDRAVHVVTDGMGRWLAVWESREDRDGAGTDRDIFWSRSTNNGKSWSYLKLLNSNGDSDSGHDRYPRIISNETDKWLVIWQSNDDFDGEADTDYDLYQVRTTNDLSAPPTLIAP